MDLSLEAYRNVVKNVGSRADLVALCRASKGFRYVAERALYNTLYMRDPHTTISLCGTLSSTPRLAEMVDALTISPSGEDGDDEDEEVDEDGEEGKGPLSLPENYWTALANALACTNRLRYLNIHLNNSPDTSTAWILDKCTFRLRRFHCDLDWDHHLVEFLNRQTDLHDLYIIDYNDTNPETPTSVAPASPVVTLDALALPNLSTLECTFSEAALTLVPDRPITHLKTCFSRSDMDEKRAEMALLFTKINQSTRPLRALDIADSSYQDRFSMELLATVVNTPATNHQLRYLGTLVLPIAGQERLRFYGLLMRLPYIQCVEVEISDWMPPPSSLPAFRALASEMRLYSPLITRVVFVHEFERTVVTSMNGVWRLDTEISTDILWRDI